MTSVPRAANSTPPTSNYVAATYVQLLYDYLESHGHDAQAMLGPMPVERSPVGVERVALWFWEQSLAAASTRLGDPAVGLAVGRTITPRHFGLLGYVVLNCANLGQALARMERYHGLIYDVNPARIEVDGDRVEVRWGVERGLSGQLVDETGIAAVVQMTRDLTGESQLVERVCFVNPPPEDIQPYQRFFGGEVRFNHAETVIRVPLDYLALPLREPDARMLAILDRQAESLLARQGESADPLEAQLARLMRERRPTLAALAAQNHTSARTLQRQLSARGDHFQALLVRTRYRLAREYLRDPRLELTEVAALLGYSEHSAFTRAFRQWSGESPARWRRNL